MEIRSVRYEQFVRVSMLPAKFNASPNLKIKSPLMPGQSNFDG